jgi:hypothetical protein
VFVAEEVKAVEKEVKDVQQASIYNHGWCVNEQ